MKGLSGQSDILWVQLDPTPKENQARVMKGISGQSDKRNIRTE
jgi:hypothetical protein